MKMDMYSKIIETIPCWFTDQKDARREAVLALTESDVRVLQADLSEFDESQAEYQYGAFNGFDPFMWEELKLEVESFEGDVSILIFG